MNRLFRLGNGSSSSSSRDNSHIHVKPLVFDAVPPLIVLYPHAILPGSQAPKSATVSGRFVLLVDKPDEWVEVVASLTKHYVAQSAVTGQKDRDQTNDEHNEYGHNPGADTGMAGRWYGIRLQIVRRLADGSTRIFVDNFPSRNVIDKRGASLSRKEWAEGYQAQFFAIVASPAEPGELPPSLERVIEEWAPQTGPMTLILTARSLTVGCLLSINFRFPDVPKETVIRQIRCFTNTTGSYTSPRANGPKWQFSPTRLRYQVFDPPFTREENDVISMAAVARLPDDRFLFASSLPGTVSPNEYHHELVFEIDVTDACMLISEWLNVPKYGSVPQSKSEFQPERLEERYCCACGFTFEQLIERDNEGIIPADQFDQVEIKPRESNQ
ncbi:hypothetical protein EMMF5_005325 [Cystobasidiomycetes sp. EMM_F5]